MMINKLLNSADVSKCFTVINNKYKYDIFCPLSLFQNFTQTKITNKNKKQVLLSIFPNELLVNDLLSLIGKYDCCSVNFERDLKSILVQYSNLD